MSTDLPGRFAFLNEADRLKSVERANVLMDLSRPENSAEHSWHVALWAMVFGASDRAIAMLLLHDLVEIDVGDHPIHLDHEPSVVARAEDAAARRIFGLHPAGEDFLALWRSFEAGADRDAALAKRFDHAQPLFQVLQARSPLADHLRIVRDNLALGRAARLHREWPELVAAALGLFKGQVPDDELGARLRFLAEADRLKSVCRATTLIDASRPENSAEHSWHLALYALALSDHAGPGVDLGRVIRMLLLHDLVEIDVGDVPLHSAAGQAHGSAKIQQAEASAARRIFGLLPAPQADQFLALWQEFEDARSPDAVFAKALDRVQPVVQNLHSGGTSWREYSVSYSDVQSRVGERVRQGAPALWDWLSPQIAQMLPR